MNPKKNNPLTIPISISLEDTLNSEGFSHPLTTNKKRLLSISFLAVLVGAVVSIVAKLLTILINLITNISFHRNFSGIYSAPAPNGYGIFVIVVPIVGGLLVGLMAYYGSKAIRGHGIPEAMEQILINKSRIKPSITYLKPLSSAISIGTGGPFGAEGPIIATGGALGSTIGQILRISHYERKILLAAGATAGMSAIFGTPVAAIFLAIELLLFEFSPRSIIPVTLACITGAAGHHLLFEAGPVFPMPQIASPGTSALAIYSAIGILTGFFSALITKTVYFLEDKFEKLPLHWMWWPALGGIAVGVVGYFAPRTLGVGYENITDILSGKMAISFVLSICILKFISWAVSLASGTSGGTLAPLLTIGSALGYLIALPASSLFPNAHISLPLSALIGMSALFAGASRALLTSVIFAIETTGQSNTLLPLLSACIASYFISYLLMKNTIMTEKIARRGVLTPNSYEPDLLNKVRVKEVINEHGLVLNGEKSLQDIRDWLNTTGDQQRRNYYIVADEKGVFAGILSSSNLFSLHHPEDEKIISIIKRKSTSVTSESSLRKAVEIMAAENVDVLPVISQPGNKIAGILSYSDILSCYRADSEDHRKKITISLKRRRLKRMVKRKRNLQ